MMVGETARRQGGERMRAALKASYNAASSSAAFSLLSDVDLLIDDAFPVPVRKTLGRDQKTIRSDYRRSKRRTSEKEATSALHPLEHGESHEDTSGGKDSLVDEQEETNGVLGASRLSEDEGDLRGKDENMQTKYGEGRLLRKSTCGFLGDEEEKCEFCMTEEVIDNLDCDPLGAWSPWLVQVRSGHQPCHLPGSSPWRKRRRMDNISSDSEGECLFGKQEGSKAASVREAAKFELHFFTRHPAAWELCCRALYRARAAVCTLEALRMVEGGEGDIGEQELLRSLLKRQMRLFSASWGEPEMEEDTAEKTMQFERNSGGENEVASAPVRQSPEADVRNVPEEDVSMNGSASDKPGDNKDDDGRVNGGKDDERTGRCDASSGNKIRTRPQGDSADEEDLLEYRLFSRALFAARVLRLLCDVGLPFLQLPTPCNASLLSAPSIRLPLLPSSLSPNTPCPPPSSRPFSPSSSYVFSSPSTPRYQAPSHGVTGSTGGPQSTVFPQSISDSPYFQSPSPSPARPRPLSPAGCARVSPSYTQESLKEEAAGQEVTEEGILNVLASSLPFDYRLTMDEGWVSVVEGLGDRGTGNPAARVSPFVAPGNSPLPLASPQQLSREMLPLIHLCCVYSEFLCSDAPCRTRKRRNMFLPRRRQIPSLPNSVHSCQFRSDEVDPRGPRCCPSPEPLCVSPCYPCYASRPCEGQDGGAQFYKGIPSTQNRRGHSSCCWGDTSEMFVADSAFPSCCQSASQGSSCQHTRRTPWLGRWEEVWRQLCAAVAALLAHAMAQQQQEGEASLPALENQTPLQRAVRLARTFCTRMQTHAGEWSVFQSLAKVKEGHVVSPRQGEAGSEGCGGRDARICRQEKAHSSPLKTVERKGSADLGEMVPAAEVRRVKGNIGDYLISSGTREQQNSQILMQTGRGREGTDGVDESVVISVRHGWFCMEVIRHLVSIADQPSLGGGRHASSPKQRRLFRTAFLKESPFVFLLLQQTLSHAACYATGSGNGCSAIAFTDTNQETCDSEKLDLLSTSDKGCQCLRLHSPFRKSAHMRSFTSIEVLRTIRAILAFWQKGLNQEHPGESEALFGTLNETHLRDGFVQNGDFLPGVRDSSMIPGRRGVHEDGAFSNRKPSSGGSFEKGERDAGRRETAEGANQEDCATQRWCPTKQEKETGLLGRCKKTRKDFTLYLMGTVSMDGGVYVQKMVETLLAFLEVESRASLEAKDPQSLWLNSWKNADCSSVREPFSAFSSFDFHVHSVGSEVLCRLFSLASSLFFVLGTSYETAWLSWETEPSPTSFSASTGPGHHLCCPSIFPVSPASLAFASAVLRLGAGECGTRTESAVQQAAFQLPRLLSWIGTSCLSSLSRASSSLLSLVRTSQSAKELFGDSQANVSRATPENRADSECDQHGGGTQKSAYHFLNRALHAALIWHRNLCYQALPAVVLSDLLSNQHFFAPREGITSRSERSHFSSSAQGCLLGNGAELLDLSVQARKNRAACALKQETQKKELRKADDHILEEVGEFQEPMTPEEARQGRQSPVFCNTAKWLPLSKCLALPLVFGESEGGGHLACPSGGTSGESLVTFSYQQNQSSGQSDLKQESAAEDGGACVKEEEGHVLIKAENLAFSTSLRCALHLPVTLLEYGAEQRVVSEGVVGGAAECLCSFFAPFVRLGVLSEKHGTESGEEDTSVSLRGSGCSDCKEGHEKLALLKEEMGKDCCTLDGERQGQLKGGEKLAFSSIVGEVSVDERVPGSGMNPSQDSKLFGLAWRTVREALKSDNLMPALLSLVLRSAVVRVPEDAAPPRAIDLHCLTPEGNAQATLPSHCCEDVSPNVQGPGNQLRESDGQPGRKKLRSRQVARAPSSQTSGRGDSKKSVSERKLANKEGGEIPASSCRAASSFKERGGQDDWRAQLERRRQWGRLLRQLAALALNNRERFEQAVLTEVMSRTSPCVNRPMSRVRGSRRRDLAVHLFKGSEAPHSQTQSGRSSTNERVSMAEGGTQEMRPGRGEYAREHQALQALEMGIWAHVQISQAYLGDSEGASRVQIICRSLLEAYLRGMRGETAQGRSEQRQLAPTPEEPRHPRCEIEIGQAITTLLSRLPSADEEEGGTQFSSLLSAIERRHRNCWWRLLLLVSAAVSTKVGIAGYLLTPGSNVVFSRCPVSKETPLGLAVSDARCLVEQALCLLYLLLEVAECTAFATRTGWAGLSGTHPSTSSSQPEVDEYYIPRDGNSVPEEEGRRLLGASPCRESTAGKPEAVDVATNPAGLLQSKTCFASGLCAYAWGELTGSLAVQLRLVNHLFSTFSLEEIATAWSGTESSACSPENRSSSGVGGRKDEKHVLTSGVVNGTGQAQLAIEELRELLLKTLVVFTGKSRRDGSVSSGSKAKEPGHEERKDEQARSSEGGRGQEEEQRNPERYRRRTRTGNHRSFEEERKGGCPALQPTWKCNEDRQAAPSEVLCAWDLFKLGRFSEEERERLVREARTLAFVSAAVLCNLSHKTRDILFPEHGNEEARKVGVKSFEQSGLGDAECLFFSCPRLHRGHSGLCATREDDANAHKVAAEEPLVSRGDSSGTARRVGMSDGRRAGCSVCRIERDSWCVHVHLAALRGWMATEFLVEKKGAKSFQRGSDKDITGDRGSDQCITHVFSSEKASGLWLRQLDLLSSFLLSDTLGAGWVLESIVCTPGDRKAVALHDGRACDPPMAGCSGFGCFRADAVALTPHLEDKGTPGPAFLEASSSGVIAIPPRLRPLCVRIRPSLVQTTVRCHKMAWREVAACLRVALIRGGTIVTAEESIEPTPTGSLEKQPFSLRESQRRRSLLERVVQLVRRYCVRKVSSSNKPRFSGGTAIHRRPGPTEQVTLNDASANGGNVEASTALENYACDSKSLVSRSKKERDASPANGLDSAQSADVCTVVQGSDENGAPVDASVESGKGRDDDRSSMCAWGDVDKLGQPKPESGREQESGAGGNGQSSSEVLGENCPTEQRATRIGSRESGCRQGPDEAGESQDEAASRGEDQGSKESRERVNRKQDGKDLVSAKGRGNVKTLVSSLSVTTLDVDRTPVAVEEGLFPLIALVSQPRSPWSGSEERSAVVRLVVDLLSGLLHYIARPHTFRQPQACCCRGFRDARDEKGSVTGSSLSTSKTVGRRLGRVRRQSTSGSESIEATDGRDFPSHIRSSASEGDSAHECVPEAAAQALVRTLHVEDSELSHLSDRDAEADLFFPSVSRAPASGDSVSGLQNQGPEPSTVCQVREGRQQGIEGDAVSTVQFQYRSQLPQFCCSVTGGCPDCITVLSSVFRRARRCVAALMKALELCLSSPLLLFVLLNEFRGFQVVSNVLRLVVFQGGLRALYHAVRQASDESEVARSFGEGGNRGTVDFFSDDTLPGRQGCLIPGHSGAILSVSDPIANPTPSVTSELREALRATLRCIVCLVQVSRKTPLSRHLLAPRPLVWESSVRRQTLSHNEVFGSCECRVYRGERGVPCGSFRCGEGRGRTDSKSVKSEQCEDFGHSVATWSDIALFGPAAEEPENGGPRFCSCCGSAIDGEEEGATVVGDVACRPEDREIESSLKRQESGRGKQDVEEGRGGTMRGLRAALKTPDKLDAGVHESGVVDSSTLVWCIGESCARAAVALLRQPTPTPLSRLLREELLFRFGLNCESQQQVFSNTVQPLCAVPPALASVFNTADQPAVSGKHVEHGSPQLSGSSLGSSCGLPASFSGLPIGTERGCSSSGILVGGSPQVQQALLVGLQHHQALQTMEEQMLRVLEMQQMVKGIAEENEGTDGGPAVLVEVLLHTICSILFESRTGATRLTSLHDMSLLEDPWLISWECNARRSPYHLNCACARPRDELSRGCFHMSREMLQSGSWRGEEVSDFWDADEEDHEHLLVLLLQEILLPPASRVFKIAKGQAKGTAQVHPAEKNVSPSGSTQRSCVATASSESAELAVSQSSSREKGHPSTSCRPPAQPGSSSASCGRILRGRPERAEHITDPYSHLYNALTIPPPLQLRRWPFILSFHVLAASSFPLSSNLFLSNTVFRRCCPCCPVTTSPRTPCESLSRKSQQQQGGFDSDKEAQSLALMSERVTRWCCCCYCFPQPHSPCPKAAAGGTLVSSVLPPLMAGSLALSPSSVFGCRVAPGTPRGTSAVESGSLFSHGVKGCRLNAAPAASGCSSIQCDLSRQCAPGALAVFASALVAAAFKPHLFSLLDTNASYSTNTWPDASGSMFSSGGSSVFSGPLKGSSGEMTGPGGLSVGRGSAASGAAAVGAPGDLGGIQQHAYLPVLLQSPPVFLLHPLQEVLLHGLPRRFGSLIAGIQAPQPHTVPPLARAAAATAKALQFTAAQQPGIDLGCRRKAELHPQAELRQEFERSAMFELVRALKQRMFAVDFLRVGALLQQQQLLHRQRQLEALATTAKSGVGTVVAPSGADFTGVHAAAEAATAIGSAAASGDVLLLLRLVAPARPAGASGPGSSPSAKETGGSKGSGGGRHGGSGAGGHSGDSYRKGGVAGGKSKGKRRD